jgi:hypothetical protein
LTKTSQYKKFLHGAGFYQWWAEIIKNRSFAISFAFLLEEALSNKFSSGLTNFEAK